MHLSCQLDVFVPNHSKGLLVDAEIIKRALGGNRVRIITYPVAACRASIEENSEILQFEPSARIAVFVERLFAHKKLASYSKRVFLPNAEWLNPSDVETGQGTLNEVWHKTKHIYHVLSQLFPRQSHIYTGFTSFESAGGVSTYDSFVHFGGRARTRHSQEVLNIWLQNKALPPLALQLYNMDISIPKWIETDNLKCFLGFLEQDEYQKEFVRHGIHICTSQMEGFGHYINEARSAGALIITLDAPPMNELIDNSCGVLVPVESSSPHFYGTRFSCTQSSILAAIEKTLTMPEATKRELGENAKERYTKERNAFAIRIRDVAGANAG